MLSGMRVGTSALDEAYTTPAGVDDHEILQDYGDALRSVGHSADRLPPTNDATLHVFCARDATLRSSSAEWRRNRAHTSLPRCIAA